jgi:hypothetical protein
VRQILPETLQKSASYQISYIKPLQG